MKSFGIPIRYTRQARLAEVGTSGQLRLQSATASCSLEGLAGEVCARYLAGAGVGRVKVSSELLAASARRLNSAVEVDVGEGSNSPSVAFPSAESPSSCEGRNPTSLLVYEWHDRSAMNVGTGAYESLQIVKAILERTTS